MKKLFKSLLMIILALLLTFWSSSTVSKPSCCDNPTRWGFPFPSRMSGTWVESSDSLAIYKNYIFWIVLLWILVFISMKLYKKLQNGNKLNK